MFFAKDKKDEKPYVYFSERINEIEAAPVHLRKELEKYNNQVKKFTDYNKTNFQKLLEFAKNDDLVDYLAELATGLEYPLFDYSFNEYRWAIVLFTLSQNNKAIEYLNIITDYAIQERHPMNGFLNYRFNDIEGDKLNGLRKKESDYFDLLYKETDFFRFSNTVGLDISELPHDKYGYHGSFSFTLSTIEGACSAWQCKSEQVEMFYSLTVRIFPPSGGVGCFSMDFRAPANKINLQLLYKEVPSSNEEKLELYFREKDEKVAIPRGTHLMNLKETIKRIETLCGNRFIPTFVGSDFSKGIKQRKNLQNWFLEK